MERKKTTMVRWILSAAALAIAVLALVEREYIEQMPLGCAFKAKALCAGIFVQGLSRERIEAEDSGFDPAFGLMRAEVDEGRKAVTCSILGTGLFSKTAVYIEGLGPVLLSGVSELRLRELAAETRGAATVAAGTAAAPAEAPDPRPWPEGDGQALPPRGESGRGGIDGAALERAIDAAFTETASEIAKLKRSRAIVVVHGGRIVAERYAPGITEDTRLLSWSMAKSFTNAMAGILVRRGKLDIRAAAPVPEWSKQGDPRRAITTDLLMRMSSGLRWHEEYADHPISDVNRMLFLEPDVAAFAARKDLASKPDSLWSYSSGSANIVSRIVKDAIGSQAAYLEFPYGELFRRIGMRSAVFGTDATGTFIGSSYLYATARDFARFGLLCLRDGVWKGERILPERWMAYSTAPTPGAPKGQYGALFWLNKGRPETPSDRRFPDMPTDLYWAEGYQGQEIFVCPSLDLVAVRLGMTWNGDWGEAAFLSAVKDAVSPKAGGAKQ